MIVPKTKIPTIIGAFEGVHFPEFGSGIVAAKIDTGAYTGALHCKLIEERMTDRGKVLVFQPLKSRRKLIKEEYAVKYVRSSNGKRSRRFFITTKITIYGKTYEILLSLANRSDMKWSVLIGRRFLRLNNFLVDPNRRSPALAPKKVQDI